MVPSLHDLDAYADRGLLTRSSLGSLCLFNYSVRTTYDRAWDPVTTVARGLLIDRATGEVLALPFPKFFNHDEPGARIPTTPADVVTVKLDGALGISYRLDGRVRWTTRGSLHSSQGEHAQRLWERDHPGVAVPEPWTLLVEIITPIRVADGGTRVIAEYDFDGLVLIGVRDRTTGRDLPIAEVQAFAAAVGMRCVEVVPGGFDEVRDRAASLDATAEGFVVRWGDHRVKVKGDAYMSVARLVQGLTERLVGDYWHAGVACPSHLPEEEQAWWAAVVDGLEAEAAAVSAEAARVARAAAPDRRAFVEAIGHKHPLFGPIMQAYSGRPVDARGFVYRRRFGGHPRPL